MINEHFELEVYSILKNLTHSLIYEVKDRDTQNLLKLYQYLTTRIDMLKHVMNENRVRWNSR